MKTFAPLRSLVRPALSSALLAAAAGTAWSQIEVFDFPLSDTQEVPPSGTGGSGSATVTLDTSTGDVTVSGSYTGLGSNQTLAHIHGPAPAGMNAAPVVTLSGTGGTSGTLSGSDTLTAGEMADMLAGLHYINVHTVLNAGGEIRGQVCREAAVVNRNPSGANPQSYTASPPVFGGTMTATVDLTTTGHTTAVLLAFDTAIEVTLSGGQRLLCIDAGGNGELFTGGGLGPDSVVAGIATYSTPTPNDLALCNLGFCSQAIHFGGVVPFELSNAQDMFLGF